MKLENGLKIKPDSECMIFVTSELRRWDFRLVSSERSLEAVGESVRLHIIGRSNVFDLFPRTDKGKNRCVFGEKHALINSRERSRTIANLTTHSTSR